MNLKFQTLIIKNFKSFLGQHEFQLNRAPGLYYISGKNKLNPELGPNGVGKTTLWDALIWVLFGSTGRDNRPAGAVVPWGLDKGTCGVELIFSLGKLTYSLVRTRRPNALMLGFVDEEPKVVEQYQIEKLLGFSEAMFRRTIVLAQFGTFFLDMRPEQQSQMFSEALNLDIWLKASKAASQSYKKMSVELTELISKAFQQRGRLIELRASRGREEKAELAYGTQLKTQLAELDKVIALKQDKVTELLGSAGPAGAALGLGLRAGGVATLAKPGTKAPAGPQLRTDLGGKALTKALLTAIATSEGGLRAIGQQRSTLSGELLGLDRALQGSKTTIRQYENTLKKDKVCPECGQSVSVSHLKTKLSTEKQKAGKLLEEQEALLKHLDELTQQIEIMEKLISTSKTILKKYEDYRTDLALLWQQRDTLESQDNPHSEIILSIKKRIRHLKAVQQEENMEIVFYEKQMGICTYWITAFKEIRLNLIDSVLNELEIAVTQHAENLGLIGWRIEFQTERTKVSGEVSTTFNTLLFPPDQEEPVKFESYSGGESQRWQLATAFGLSEILLSRMGITPNLEVLDEPTKGLSPEGINDLLEHLVDRAKELKRAIYVTEHHSLERGLFDQVITIQLDQKGSSIKE